MFFSFYLFYFYFKFNLFFLFYFWAKAGVRVRKFIRIGVDEIIYFYIYKKIKK